MKKVFVDSSVLFSAVNSPSGGSAKLFTLSKIQLVVTPVVLAETERNVRRKLMSFHLERFFSLTMQLKIISQKPDVKLIERAKRYTAEKDAAILAEAKNAKVDILATLDKKHLLTKKANEFLKPGQAMTPKMIIEMKNNLHLLKKIL